MSAAITRTKTLQAVVASERGQPCPRIESEAVVRADKAVRAPTIRKFRIVQTEGALDYAEDQARRRKQVFLQDWKEKLDQFLQFNERNVLPGMGGVSREQADDHAHEHYARFEQRRRTAAELEAEEDAVKQLTETAKKLSTSPAPTSLSPSAAEAPTGQPHTSPGQRPGSNGPKKSRALKGRDKGGQP